MRIGYACLAIAVPGSEMKHCTLKNASRDRLMSLTGHNLEALDQLIGYNVQKGIRLFRISSDLIPFGSSLALDLPWQRIYQERLSAIGHRILASGMRVSMHPGQYTVLNSPDDSVARRAVLDLEYHAAVLDSMGLGREHKIILHVGGVYGDKEQAVKRFIARYKDLDPGVKRRLVLENDHRQYHIEDVLQVADTLGIPVVYDNLHNQVNQAAAGKSDGEWIKACKASWSKQDGPQKVHYSQQDPAKTPGAHSAFIRIDPFLEFWNSLSGMDVDVMLEVKDKNLSALKCIHCTQGSDLARLETEWSHYKYLVLERSLGKYQEIRRLLGDKTAYPALEFYRIIEDSLDLPVTAGNAVNAAEHVWGYFKNQATEAEKKRFSALCMKLVQGETGTCTVKKHLKGLALRYQEDYLLNGYYFYL